MTRYALATAVFAAFASTSNAQTQQVKPPVAVYWMSIETHAGMGMSMPVGLGGFLPQGAQGAQSGKRMKLDLGSAQNASGTPRANHAIPAGLSMGQSLPLVTPEGQRAAPRGETDEQPFERPKGRILVYWGCGETIRAGQPVIVDFAKMGSADAKAFRSRNISRPAGPAPGRNRTYGDWPNRESSTGVPQQASLVGEHTVAGNYSPDIQFTVGDRHDFMAPVAFDPVRKTSAGAFQVKWQGISTAIGYFATASAPGESQNDFVMWSSSDVQEMGHALMDHLPPSEVQRLLKERIVLSPQTTECTVPAGIFKGEGAMLNFIAYGDELNFVHPPRPKDPRQVWEQQYAVKVRLKSTGMTMLAEGDMGGRARGRGDTSTQQADERTVPQQPARAPTAADAVQEGVNMLRGLFGR